MALTSAAITENMTDGGCAETEAILANPLLKASFTAGSILAPIGILLNILILLTLRRAKALHLNVRIQIGNVSISSICYCVAFLARACWIWISQAVGTVCKFSMSVRECVLLEIPYTVITAAMVLSLLVVGIERAVATRRHATYEDSASIGAWIGAIACWLNGASMSGIFYLATDQNRQGTIALCNALFAADKTAIAIICIAHAGLCVLILIEYIIIMQVIIGIFC